MEERHRRKLLDIAGPDVRFDRPMRLYTTFRVGGPASVFVRARSMVVLKRIHSYVIAHEVPWLVAGKGSNILVSDRGFEGVVIRLRGELAEVDVHPAQGGASAGGGATIRRFLDRCAERGLGGLEFLAGIPGTVGGAVAMNAGALGRETGDVVREVEILTSKGTLVTHAPNELGFSYRRCRLPRGAVVTRASFEVRPETPGAVRNNISRNLERRRRTQPLGFPSAGSVFQNPPGDSAWRLVERAGMKGKRIGGAEISKRHANVIVNRGGATAQDILSLINLAREQVLRCAGVELESEIRPVGFG